jgi:mRNA interferase RelE/StbE
VKYTLIVTPKAERQFLRLDATVQSRVTEAMAALCDNPRPFGSLKMKAGEGYRVRVGEYRVVYEIHDRTITVIVVGIGHRRDIYR